MDRAAIYSDLCRRNALRKEAKLPLLNVHAEYRRLVEVQRWAEIVEQHWEVVEAEILAEKRRERSDWGISAGGRLALRLLTLKTLRERYCDQSG
jgi:hypothetical protein